MSYGGRKVPWEKLPDQHKLQFAKKATKYFELAQKADAILDELGNALDCDPYEIRNLLEQWVYVDNPNPAEIYEEVR